MPPRRPPPPADNKTYAVLMCVCVCITAIQGDYRNARRVSRTSIVDFLFKSNTIRIPVLATNVQTM